MKTTSKILVFAVAVAATTITFGCKREGCTDSKATNYDSKAKTDDGSCNYVMGCMDVAGKNYNADATKDDGTCTYEGKVVFWWNKTFMDSCQAYGVATVKVYFNNVFEGSAPISAQYWSSGPECAAQGALTIIKDLGSSKSKSYTNTLKFLDGTGNEISTDNSTTTLTANTCLKEEWAW